MKRAADRADLKTASLCVVGDHDPRLGMTLPIQPSTAFHYLDDGPQPYPRYFNTPNQESVARKLAALEHGEEGLVFSSGMAAITTCILSMVSPGDHVLLLQGLYGGSHSFVMNELKRWGVEFDFCSADVNEFRQKRKDNTVLVYIETPNNPCLEILDIAAIAEFARGAGIVSVIDNTFATPINQTPIDLGIDLVVHSGTKYLGGHSDLSCGAVVGSTRLMAKVMRQARMNGGNLNALSCYLLDRSLKTLDLRVQRQNRNAQTVAEFLAGHRAATRVLYPGLEDHPGHDVAVKQMQGFGGMLSFELVDSGSVGAFLRRLKLITPAMSLGGVESSVTVPVFTSHKEMPAQDRADCGVTPGLIRCSIGVEDADDLLADLDQALNGQTV